MGKGDKSRILWNKEYEKKYNKIFKKKRRNKMGWSINQHCPYKHKYELMEWAAKHFIVPKSRFKKCSKKQMYAMWYNAGRK